MHIQFNPQATWISVMSVQSRGFGRRSYTPVRSRKGACGRRSRRHRSSSSSFSPSSRRSRDRRRSSSSSSPERCRHRRSRSSSYSASPRRSRGKHNKHRYRKRSKSPSGERSRKKRQENGGSLALQEERASGYGFGTGSWSGYGAVDQFVSHPEYPGWVFNETTGIWYPVTGPPAQGTVSSSVVSTPAVTSAPIVKPTAAAGAPKPQEAVVAKYPHFEPVSDVEADPAVVTVPSSDPLPFSSRHHRILHHRHRHFHRRLLLYSKDLHRVV